VSDPQALTFNKHALTPDPQGYPFDEQAPLSDKQGVMSDNQAPKVDKQGAMFDEQTVKSDDHTLLFSRHSLAKGVKKARKPFSSTSRSTPVSARTSAASLSSWKRPSALKTALECMTPLVPHKSERVGLCPHMQEDRIRALFASGGKPRQRHGLVSINPCYLLACNGFKCSDPLNQGSSSRVGNGRYAAEREARSLAICSGVFTPASFERFKVFSDSLWGIAMANIAPLYDISSSIANTFVIRVDHLPAH